MVLELQTISLKTSKLENLKTQSVEAYTGLMNFEV
jgi:hypothetical protein